jgi:threonyl-tRNA synthetase
VAVRDRIDGDLGAMPVEAAVEKLLAEVAAKTVRKVARSEFAPQKKEAAGTEY